MEIIPATKAVQDGMQEPQSELQKSMKQFWAVRTDEMLEMTDHKQHQLPLARIKRVMKSDEHVKMISAEAPLLFAKACEIFIQELTFRAWMHTEEGNRRTLQRADIANGISKASVLDFLLDIVPKEHNENDQTAGIQRPPFQGQFIPPQPNGPNVPIGSPFPMRGPNLIPQNHLGGEEIQMMDMNGGRNIPFFMNNGVPFPVIPLATNLYAPQMNFNPVADGEFYGSNVGGAGPNGFYYPPTMNPADQFHPNYYAGNQAGPSNFGMIGRNEAKFQAAPANFGMIGNKMAEFQAGPSNFSTVGNNLVEFQAGPSNGMQYGMMSPNFHQYQNYNP